MRIDLSITIYATHIDGKAALVGIRDCVKLNILQPSWGICWKF